MDSVLLNPDAEQNRAQISVLFMSQGGGGWGGEGSAFMLSVAALLDSHVLFSSRLLALPCNTKQHIHAAEGRILQIWTGNMLDLTKNL